MAATKANLLETVGGEIPQYEIPETADGRFFYDPVAASDEVMQPINGDAKGKNLLSVNQLSESDILDYLSEAHAAQTVYEEGIDLIPRGVVLKLVMRQESTRTGGSMQSAMHKLGGSPDLYSGMKHSAEAKGESPEDTWVAFATQANMIGTRTKEEYGPHFAAWVIDQELNRGNLTRPVPVFNLGDGQNEHPTQALGDLFTIQKHFGEFKGLKLALVGDHERYRAFHSVMPAAARLGIQIIAVESSVAPVTDELVYELGDSLIARTTDLNEAMEVADALYVGRNPDEYEGTDTNERLRSKILARDYESWIIDRKRLQIMPADSIVLHARPRRNELHHSGDSDPRRVDAQQMEDIVIMRMAIIARHLGKSIKSKIQAA